jgi:hypothetical protein
LFGFFFLEARNGGNGSPDYRPSGRGIEAAERVHKLLHRMIYIFITELPEAENAILKMFI